MATTYREAVAFDFAIQTRGASTLEGLDTWHAKADGKAAIDYGFHMIVTDLPDARVPELRRLADEGLTSYKLFMAYPIARSACASRRKSEAETSAASPTAGPASKTG